MTEDLFSVEELNSFLTSEIDSDLSKFDLYELQCGPDEDELLAFSNENVATSPESGFDSDSAAGIMLDRPSREEKIEPYLEILEEPEKLVKFRYLKEAKVPHGPILGENHDKKRPSWKNRTDCGPKVKLHNFSGDAIIRCWLTQPGSSEAHVHQLVVSGQPVTEATREPHEIKVSSSNDYTASFDKLNVIHVVTEFKDDQKDYWRRKHLINTDYKSTPSNIKTPFDKQKIRNEIKRTDKDKASLYFEAFAEIDGEYKSICPPKISREFKNTKSPKSNELKIHNYLPSRGTCKGNDEMIILVDKVVKGIKVQFFKKNDDDEVIWAADVTPDDIHKQVAIVLRTPQFNDTNLHDSEEVYFKIVRLSSGDESPPRKFIYLPSGNQQIGKKRRIDNDNGDSVVQPAPERCTNYQVESFRSGEACPEIIFSYYDMDSNLLDLTDFQSGDEIVDEIHPVSENIELDSSQSPMAIKNHSRPVSNSEPVYYPAPSPVYLQLHKAGSLMHVECEAVKSSFNCRCTSCSFSKRDNVLLSLLEEGNLNKRTIMENEEHLGRYNRAGETVLLSAIRLGYIEEVQRLLEFRPSLINQRTLTGDDGPFHVAVKNRRKNITSFLLDSGFNWNNVNCSNHTPLHYAVRLENEDLIKLLISKTKIDIKPKFRITGDDDDDDSNDDDDDCGSSDADENEERADGFETLKGPLLNGFTSNEKILNLLRQMTSSPRRAMIDRDSNLEDLNSQVAQRFKFSASPKTPFQMVENSMKGLGQRKTPLRIESTQSNVD